MSHTRLSDGSIHLTWQMTAMSAHQKYETQWWRRALDRERQDIYFSEELSFQQGSPRWRRTKKKVSILGWNVNCKFCLKLLLRPVPSSYLTLLSTTGCLFADGFIHLTWQPTSENCFGVMMGQSQTERRIETHRREEAKDRVIEFIAL